MSFGFRSYNDSGVVQIDQDYQNFVLTGKGSGLTTVYVSNPDWYVATISGTGNSPMLAIKSSEPWTVLWTVNSGSTFTFTILMLNSGNFDYWVFDIPTVLSPSSDTFGMRVWTADSELAFHSSLKIMRLIDFLNVDPLSGPDARGDGGAYLVTGSYTSGRTYAMIQSSFLHKSLEELAIVQDPFNPPGFNNYVHFAYYSFMSVVDEVCTSTCIRIEQSDYVANAPNDLNYEWGQQAALVIDVTDF